MPRDIKPIVESLKQKNLNRELAEEKESQQLELTNAIDEVRIAVVDSVNTLLRVLVKGELKTKVSNYSEFPKTIKIPPATQPNLKPVLAHLKTISGLIGKLPTKHPEAPKVPSSMAINNFKEVTKELTKLNKSLSGLKLDPKIHVDAPKISLSKELKRIETAVSKIKPTVVVPDSPPLDTSDLRKAVEDVKQAIESIKFPVPNFRTQDIVDAIDNLELTAGDITVASFSDSGGTDRKGLVDADRHVQVDVLSAPPASIDTTGLATEPKQDSQITELQAIKGNQLADDHNVTVSNQITQPTTPSDTQPVSASSLPLPTGAATSANQQTDALTNAELRFEAIDVNTGLGADIEDIKSAVEGTLTVDTELTPLTDTELRATPVPVSGTVTANKGSGFVDPQTDALTDSELRASAVPVSASSLPLPAGASTATKQDDALAQLKQIRGFDIPEYDEIDLAYVAEGNGEGEIETVVYKNNDATVATLTLGYDGSNNLINVSIS